MSEVSGPVTIRWGRDPLTGDEDWERGLREMCDYGARRVAKGDCDAIRFEVMKSEVEFIDAYMAETHPSVRYFFGMPVSRNSP